MSFTRRSTHSHLCIHFISSVDFSLSHSDRRDKSIPKFLCYILVFHHHISSIDARDDSMIFISWISDWMDIHSSPTDNHMNIYPQSTVDGWSVATGKSMESVIAFTSRKEWRDINTTVVVVESKMNAFHFIGVFKRIWWLNLSAGHCFVWLALLRPGQFDYTLHDIKVVVDVNVDVILVALIRKLFKLCFNNVGCGSFLTTFKISYRISSANWLMSSKYHQPHQPSSFR